MSNFKIDTSELETLASWFARDTNAAKYAPDIISSISKFQNTLESRVADVFTAKVKLSSVKVGGNSVIGGKGINSLNFTLAYKNKPLRLDQFKFNTVTSSALSTAPLRIPKVDTLGFIKWTQGQFSKQVNVEVVRGRVTNGSYKKQSQPAFRVKNGNSIRLRARKTESTWKTYPTKGALGDRANTTLALFGPPLAIQANAVFDKDKTVIKAWAKMQDEIATTLTKSYLT